MDTNAVLTTLVSLVGIGSFLFAVYEYRQAQQWKRLEDVFSRLFSYLAQIYAFIEMKLIRVNDVKALKWILQFLANPRWADDKRVFISRISRETDDVLRLMDLFGIEHAPVMTSEEIEAMAKKYGQC